MPRKKNVARSPDLPAISTPLMLRDTRSGHVRARTRGPRANAIFENGIPRITPVDRDVDHLQNTTNLVGAAQFHHITAHCLIVNVCKSLLGVIIACLQLSARPSFIDSIDSCLPWQVPPTNISHSDTAIRARSPPPTCSNTAERGARRMRGTLSRSSLSRRRHFSDWSVLEHTDKHRRLIG